jgi:hypothetical protein
MKRGRAGGCCEVDHGEPGDAMVGRVKIVAIVQTYNRQRFIEGCLDHRAEQGMMWRYEPPGPEIVHP